MLAVRLRRFWPATTLLLIVAFYALARGTAPAADPAGDPPAASPPTAAAQRVLWTTSRFVGTPDPPPAWKIKRVFEDWNFTTPVDLTNAPGTDRLFLVQLDGRIFSFETRAESNSHGRWPSLFADVIGAVPSALQVYGLTFHPDFAHNRYCYISYAQAAALPDGARVSRFNVTRDDPPRIDPASEQVIITFLSGGHMGGAVKFGPDGCLYITTGDAEAPFPPDKLQTGQDISDLLSSILRIDADHPAAGMPYSIPSDNPFVEEPGARGEVWAYGFRNPWKISFDPATGDLWTGDVGWELMELVYRVERGGNYGWSVMEGSQSVLFEAPRGPTPILPPTMEHSHTESRSVTGGYVYRGSRYPDLVGAYVYGDFDTGKIWGLRLENGQVAWHQELVDTSLRIVSFGVDNAGELFILDHEGGIYRLEPNSGAQSNKDFPRRLSESGLFASTAELVAAPGVMAYQVNAQPWEDQAESTRLMGLPGETQIDASAKPWKFPEGAVLAKTVSMPTADGPRRLETQVLHFDGATWNPYTYIWDDEQQDAELVGPEGGERTYSVLDSTQPSGRRTETWPVASRAQCTLCHNFFAGSVLGCNAAQLNGPVNESGNGREDGPVNRPGDRTFDGAGSASGKNQLDQLAQLGILTGWTGDKTARLVDPHDQSESIDDRARSYLHVNCAHCHQRHAGGTANIELLFDLPLDKTAALSARPTQGTFGIQGAQVVAPGDPYSSVLYYRLAKLGRGHMPRLGSEAIDEQGLRLIHDWIASLPPADDKPKERDTSREVAALDTLRAATAADSEEVMAAVDELLAGSSSALALVRAADTGKLPPGVNELVIAKGSAHYDAQISGLFERFLPADRRAKRLGSHIRPEQILKLEGDAQRGRELFLRAEGIQCRTCHRVGEQGTELGPDLSRIGAKHTRAQLLESLLEPSKTIDPKFLSYALETTGGQVYTGLLVEKNADRVVLKDSRNQAVEVPLDEVERIAPQPASLMPDLLLREMSAPEVADLLEFMSGLK